MRRAPEASSSPRRLCPGAPYGLKVSAGGLERRAAAGRLRAQGEEAGGGRPVQPGQKFGRSGAVCGGPPRLRSGSPPTFRRAARPAVGVGPPGRRRRRGGLSLPRAPRAARAGILAGGAGGRGRAASPRSAEREPRGAVALEGGPHRRSPEGPFCRAAEPGTPGRAFRGSDRPGGRRVVFGNSAFVRPVTFPFLRTEAEDQGEAGAGFPLPLSNVPLSLVLNLRSPPPPV